MSNSSWPHKLQQARLPCPSPTPGACSNSRPSSRLLLCHPLLLLSSIGPNIRVFSNESILQSGGQSIGVSASASVLPMNMQGWFPLGWTGLISLLSKGLSRVFSNTTVQKHQLVIDLRVFMSNGSGAVCSRREAQSMQRPWGRASSEGGGTAVVQKYLETEWRRGRTLIKTLLEGGCQRNRVNETTGKTRAWIRVKWEDTEGSS